MALWRPFSSSSVLRGSKFSARRRVWYETMKREWVPQTGTWKPRSWRRRATKSRLKISKWRPKRFSISSRHWRRDGGGADDEHPVHALAEHQLLHDEAGFDGLAQAHVVGDEEVDAGQLERLLERSELVIEQVNAGAERGLEEPGVGGGDGAPLEGVEVGGEVAGLVEPGGSAEAALRGADDACAELALPEHGERAALSVVIQAGEAHEGVFLANAGRGDDCVHEVLAVAHLGDVAGTGKGVGMHGAQCTRTSRGMDAASSAFRLPS